LAKAERKASTLRVALLGAETLLGREIVEVLKSRSKSVEVENFSANGEGNFGEEQGEAIYIEPLGAKALEGDAAIIVAGTAAGAQKTYELVKAAGGRPSIIDCTGYLENEPEARIIAPPFEEPSEKRWLSVVAHPAAAALSAVLQRLAGYRPIRQSVAHVFEPASERGKAGISELHSQTTNLLSFKSLDKAVFDAQVGFNMLAAYGDDAPTQLASVEQRIERDTATILARTSASRNVPMPSVRVLQAPVFHGYSISLWIQFEGTIEATQLAEALASAHIEVRGPGEEAPTAVGAASQSGLVAGDIRVDPNNPQAAWLWIVGDNLRLVADVAADLVSALTRSVE
jgi:aspartate-semialdehyde dehydrogenase